MDQRPRCRLLVAAAATTTPQIYDMIGWMKKTNRAPRAARTIVHRTKVRAARATPSQSNSFM